MHSEEGCGKPRLTLLMKEKPELPLVARSAECILAVCSLLPITGMKADVIHAYAQAWFSSAL